MRALDDLFICLRFLSRFPVPATRREAELGAGGFAAAAAMVPVAGAVIGLIPTAVVLCGSAIRLPALPTATIAIAALVLATGALHEDALADCADGFGGGQTREDKLAIMRDSRIGAYGTCAIVLSLMIRAASLAAIAARQPSLAVVTIIVATSLSRTACLLPLCLLPPARNDGLGAAAGRPSDRAFAIAIGIATGFGLVLLASGIRPTTLAAACGLAFAAAQAVTVLARRQIGGQTGDVVGAAQQAAECTALLMLSAAA